MRERDVEQYLVKQTKAAGGRAYKFVSPGNNGVPDRIVTLPGGRIAFAELKAPGKKPTALQINQQRFIASLGLPVTVIDNKEDVDELIRQMREHGGLPPWVLPFKPQAIKSRKSDRLSKIDDERTVFVDDYNVGELPPWPQE